MPTARENAKHLIDAYVEGLMKIPGVVTNHQLAAAMRITFAAMVAEDTPDVEPIDENAEPHPGVALVPGYGSPQQVDAEGKVIPAGETAQSTLDKSAEDPAHPAGYEPEPYPFDNAYTDTDTIEGGQANPLTPNPEPVPPNPQAQNPFTPASPTDPFAEQANAPKPSEGALFTATSQPLTDG